MVTSTSNRQIEIIEAAGKILTKSGISGLTTKNLAKEMNFSESALYRHFKSKEEIIVGMLRYLITNLESNNFTPQGKDLLPEEKLKVHFKNQFNFLQHNSHFVVAVFSDGLFEQSQRINQTILALMEMKKNQLMPIIRDGQKIGSFTKAIPAEDLLHIIMGAVRLQMFKWRVANFAFDINDKGNKLIQNILKLIKN